MFKLYFNYNGKDIALYDCYGLEFSTAWRMRITVKKNGRFVTKTYVTERVANLMLSFY